VTDYKNKYEDEKPKTIKEGEDNISEYIKLENNIKDYQKQLEEKDQLLNQINNVQTILLKERKELENNYNLNIKEKKYNKKTSTRKRKSKRHTESGK
jgi:hypothetical protein